MIDKAAPNGSSALGPTTIGKARPFLKWVGGKRQLLPHIRQFYPTVFGHYIEPFVGSGAVFFDLHNRGLLNGRRSTLFDDNADLVGCYLNVRDHTAKVVRNLSRLSIAHQKGPKEHYYRIRDERFNPGRRRIFRGNSPDSAGYTPSLAAMLIYLNRTGYNGLFRLNSRGLFNVPVGRYANPRICDSENLRVVADALSGDVDIVESSFAQVLENAEQGDFVYFDPPYAPLSQTAQFTSYTAGGFTAVDQKRLQQVVIQLADRGCWVLLSNSTAPEISRLYDGNTETEAVGLRAYTVQARRAINSAPEKRGAVLEYLISNVPRKSD